MATAPTFERLLPAPPPIRAEIEALARAWLRDDRKLPELSAGAKGWIEGCWTCLSGGALWIAEGGFVRRLSLPAGRPDGEWALPDLRSAFAAGGVTIDPDPGFPETFQPGYALDGDRLLWLLRGYDAKSEYVCVPVVFDPRGSHVWTPLRPATARDGLLRGTSLRDVRASGSPGKFLAIGEVDSGASSSEFDMVVLGWELDLGAQTFSFVENPVFRNIPSGRLAVAPVHLVEVPEPLHFMVKAGRLVPNGKPTLGPAGVEVSIPLAESEDGKDVSLSTRAAGGSASPEAILISDLVTHPGARRIALWT